MKPVAPLAFALSVLALSASSSAQPAPSATPATTGHACFWRQDVTNFNAINDTTIYLRVGVSQVWQLNLFGNCFDLTWLHHIGLQSFPGDNSICEGETPGLNIITRGLAIGRQQCPVTSVRKLTPAEVAAIPKAARP
jgi:hypothetical protein